MVYEVDVPNIVRIEKYYTLRGIVGSAGGKKVIREKEFSVQPTIVQIAQFLKDSNADFAAFSENYRIVQESDLPFA